LRSTFETTHCPPSDWYVRSRVIPAPPLAAIAEIYGTPVAVAFGHDSDEGGAYVTEAMTIPSLDSRRERK
jgi:hypothetical protein